MSADQLTFAGIPDGTVCRCERCNVPIRMDPKPDSRARMLERAQKPQALCVNCALHDCLRNTYPLNILLAESGPSALAHDHIRRQIEKVMRVGNADAFPDEIDWDRIAENWELPFPGPVKPSAENPMSEKALREIKQGTRRALRPPANRARDREVGNE